jgi:ectoine hydroxylase-related dioxygenase (phytanoyl-CoA dioxygenase family)
MPDSLQHLPADAPATELIAALERDGAVIIDDLLDADLLARFNTELDPLLTAPPAHGEFINPAIEFFFGSNTRHITAVPAKSRVFSEEILINPALLSICDAILGPSCASYQLNLAHVLDRGPGTEQQIMHRDELVWNYLPKPHAQVQLATIIALVDFTAENGATRVIPGSHTGDAEMILDPTEIEARSVPAEMKAGSAVVYLGSTLHGGGHNATSDQWRRGMHVSYVVGWLRTEENNYLSLWPDVIHTLPRRSQELLGFGAHDAVMSGGGYLGTYDLQDPVELMARGDLK